MDPNENGSVQGQEAVAEQPSENAVTPDTNTGTDNASQQQEVDVYAEYLAEIPTSLHSVAREAFKKFDGNVTKQFQKRAEEVAPYKEYIDAYEPDAIASAIRLAEAMESNPQGFLEAMAQAYGITPYQAQQVVEQQLEEAPQVTGGPLDPDAKLQEHESMLRALAETILNDRQQREEEILRAQQEEEYDNTMKALHEKYGEFDQVYVNNLLAAGVQPNQAVEMWQQAVGAYAQKQLQPNVNAPKVMSAGGGTPSIQRDVETLSNQETRKLVEQMLAAASDPN